VTDSQPSTRQKRRQNLIFGWSRSCIPHNEAPIGGTCTKHQLPPAALRCAAASVADSTNSCQFRFCFPSGRLFFFCFVAAQRSPTFFRKPQCHITYHHTHHRHHTKKKTETPRAASPFFGKFNQPTRVALFSAPHSARRQPQPFRAKSRQIAPCWAELGLTKRTASPSHPSHH
jgi:hypothetical protein